MKPITTKSTLWRYSGDKASWIFVTLDKAAQKKVDGAGIPRKGWGSLKVQATIGKTSWKTSIFPDKTAGWILPIKADVRKKEGVDEDDIVKITLKLI